MNPKAIVGSNVETITQRLVDVIRALSHNKVVKLDTSLAADTLPYLPVPLQETDALFGLRLTLQTKPSMVHSGWHDSHFLEACRKYKLDPATAVSLAVSLYSDGLFREFKHFPVLETEVYFLGFGETGANLLADILQAELQFNPNDFDRDGYAK